VSQPTLFSLQQDQIPTHWYNLLADVPQPLAPPLHPGTRKPASAADFAPIFAPNIIEQEMCSDRQVKIPDEVRQIYALWRPTPLRRAVRLEQALNTPAHIYYKYEGVSPAGSHKPNSAVPQAYYNKQAGIKRIATETGAGQWGSSLALACSYFGIECIIYMVKVSYQQKPYRKSLMQTWGATAHASPSENTEYGRSLLKQNRDHPGSLGIAISEALEDTVRTPGTKYALGSVLNHVCMHQTVIGQEAIRQMELAGEEPDVVIGCAGGGSNFAGIAFPFLHRNLHDKKKHRPGRGGAGLLPLAHQRRIPLRLWRHRHDDPADDDVQRWVTISCRPASTPAACATHGMAPTVSHLHKLGLIEARAYHQKTVFDAAVQFAKTEGIIPAPESAHAIRAAIDEAIEAREQKHNRVILFNLSGHGFMDMSAYDSYLAGKLGEE